MPSKDLKEAFHEALERFNGTEYLELRRLLDPDVILKRVDDPGSVVGIGNVMEYLLGRQKDLEPSLKLDEEDWKGVTYHPSGQVSGIGRYRDSKNDKDGTLVRFTFWFTRKTDQEPWLLINAFAAPH